jgi:RNase adapter protein RapZ
MSEIPQCAPHLQTPRNQTPRLPPPRSIVLVTGLSGAGKASILRALEDVGFEAVDNPPLAMLSEMVTRTDNNLAIGVDARTLGFDADSVLQTIVCLRADKTLRVELVFAWADESTLIRRYTESRRRHPLAPNAPVTEGIRQETALTALLREQADLVLNTSDLPIAHLRRMVEQHFGPRAAEAAPARMTVSLISFGYPQGLPQEADLVFDARFLRNPHYDPILRPKTGLDAEVGAHVEADPDYANFFARLSGLLDLMLPRFVQEGKRYATITVGCTGGRHRSVHLVEKLADHITSIVPSLTHDQSDVTCPWRVFVTHRELVRLGDHSAFLTERPVAPRTKTDLDKVAHTLTVQAQEA